MAMYNDNTYTLLGTYIALFFSVVGDDDVAIPDFGYPNGSGFIIYRKVSLKKRGINSGNKKERKKRKKMEKKRKKEKRKMFENSGKGKQKVESMCTKMMMMMMMNMMMMEFKHFEEPCFQLIHFSWSELSFIKVKVCNFLHS